MDSLAAADPAQRARFADIALLELAEIYLAEADLARGEAQDSKEGLALRGWAGAVGRYANELLALADAVEAGAPVTLMRYPHEVPGISVDEHTVMLSHPRASQQPVFEQAVLERFCAGGACDELVVADAPPAPAAPAVVSPHWEFAANASVCSWHGLALRFALADDLARRRDLCRQFLQEVETLAQAIAGQVRYGVQVDWPKLQVRSLPGKPGQLVTLNAAGDSVLAQLPLLAATPTLPGAVLPWLEPRVAAGAASALTLSAADLGWE